MYNCHPQPSHQLPFDQGVQIVISPSTVVYVPELNRVIYQYFASIETQLVVMTSSEWRQNIFLKLSGYFDPHKVKISNPADMNPKSYLSCKQLLT